MAFLLLQTRQAHSMMSLPLEMPALHSMTMTASPLTVVPFPVLSIPPRLRKTALRMLAMVTRQQLAPLTSALSITNLSNRPKK